MATLSERLENNEVILLDGATGTELDRRGAPMDGVVWSAAAIETHPDILRQIHVDHIQAGAEVVITNSFGTSRNVLEAAGFGDKIEALNRRSVELALEARAIAGVEHEVFVAGSISSFSPGNDHSDRLPESIAREVYTEQAALLVRSGVDLIMLEMMRRIDLATYAIESALTTGMPVWVGMSCRRADDGTMLLWDGEPFDEALDALLALGGQAIIIMHTLTEDTVDALAMVKAHWDGPFGAYPHSGEFVMPNWQFHDIISPDDFCIEARQWVDMGAQIIGGCCGITPDHIRVLAEQIPRTRA